MSCPATPVVRALMDALVDFAGLFPPAGLSMSDAVAVYDGYRRSADAFALGLFVVPVARLREFGECLAALPESDDPWRLSVLASDDEVHDVFRFADTQRGRIIVDAIETKVATVSEIEQYSMHCGRKGTHARHYLEIPLGPSVPELVSAMARYSGMRAKIRTGGVTTDAFPSAENIVRFLVACRDHGVAFKATAGLHHPLRGDYRLTYADDSAKVAMYGYLNVFLAALFLDSGCTETDALELLNERSATAVRFTRDAIEWRGFRADLGAVTEFRERGASFGSCSFREPVDELQSLGLL